MGCGGVWDESTNGGACGGVTTRVGCIGNPCGGPEEREVAATPGGAEVRGVADVGRVGGTRFGWWYRMSVEVQHVSSSSVEDGTDEALVFGRVSGRRT